MKDTKIKELVALSQKVYKKVHWISNGVNQIGRKILKLTTNSAATNKFLGGRSMIIRRVIILYLTVASCVKDRISYGTALNWDLCRPSRKANRKPQIANMWMRFR